MTLFKQIALMLSLFLYIILTTVMVLNFQSANKSVKDRLYEDAKNTASSLSLSLGSANGNLSMMSTMINANFDSGNYSKITLFDVEENTLFERKTEVVIKDIPQWFIKLLSIKAPTASANVSAGWNQVGILKVQSDSTYAYRQLYAIFIDLIISFGVIAIISLIILNYIIHVILKPLNEVQKQAAAVIRNEFIIQNKTPYTKEFKDVVIGMNNMVTKVKVMFDKGNEELKKYKEQEYIDKDTLLKNRKYLIDKLPEYLKVDAPYNGGINMLIALSGMVEANEKIGRQSVNTLILSLVDIFKKYTKDFKDTIIVRLNGTEFSILMPNHTIENSIEIVKSIKEDCLEKIELLNLDKEETFVSIGIYEYLSSNTISELLSHSDNSLAQAKFNPSGIHVEKAQNVTEIMGKEVWKSVIREAIQNNKFNFVSWKVLDTKTDKIAHNVLSINLVFDDKNIFYSYAQFMAPAIQVGQSISIYENIVQMLFNNSNKLSDESTYSLRLPQEYLEHKDTYNTLNTLLHTHSLKLHFKLIIELPDKLVRENSKLIRNYIELFREYDIDIGIFEFIGEGEDYQYIQNLRPVYIKAQSDYFLSQSDQSLSALRLITDTVGISLISVGVMDINTLNKLKNKDIHIVQGYVTEVIEQNNNKKLQN